MSLPRYPKYKDSGTDWLGVVPACWRVTPLWTLFRRTRRTGHEGEPLLSVYRDYGVIPKASRDDNNNKASDDLSVYQLVRPGDLAVNKMKAWQGSVAISEHRGIVSPAYFIYEAIHQQNARYLHYLLRSPRYITGYLAISKGIRVNQWDLEPQHHSRMPVVLPPGPEQAAIAAFLDRETAKIDALIAEQEKLIALLAEKRQAAISHAVTKGLDPDAPMKNSGVAGLGEVPGHWETGCLKRFAEVIDCKHHTVKFLDEGLPIVSIRELRNNRIDLSDAKLTSPEEWNFLREDRAPQCGDLIFCRNASVGAVGYVGSNERPFCMGQDVCIIRPQTKARFMHYQLTGLVVRNQIEALLVGATIRRANVEEIRGLVVTWPPADEQAAIADFLERETARLDALTNEAARATALLQERRTALISAAVTGQIDVRQADTC